MIKFYQKYLSPYLHAISRSVFSSLSGCRYSPTCSEYTRQAITKYGIIRGGILGLKRLSRCHPYSHHPSFDPVP